MTAANQVVDYCEDGDVHVASEPWGGLAADLLVFLIPLSEFIQVDIVGKLFAPDMMLLVLFPVVMLWKGHVLNKKLPRTFLLLGLVWLLGQITSDVLRATPFEDYVRGWAMIAFTLTNFAVLYVLLFQNARRIILYTIGLALGGIVTYFLNPNAFAVQYAWKFGYGSGVTVLIMLLAIAGSARSKGTVAVAVMLFASALNIYNDYRSLGGECFLMATYLIVQQTACTRRGGGVPVGVMGILIGSAVLAISGMGILRIYEYYAASGTLGYTAQQKYEAQSSGQYGLLFGGRTEFLVGLEAALDSPIVGHGSWAKDWRYAGEVETLQKDAGYGTVGPSDSWLIPSHSCLIGAWVSAGILGLAFWLWVMSLFVRTLGGLTRNLEPVGLLIVFLAMMSVWDVLFSPYGAERRFIVPYYVVAMMSALS
jgi:hypothetical protein